MKAFDDAYGFDEKVAEGTFFNIRGIKTKLAFMHGPKVEAAVEVKRKKMEESLGRTLTDAEHEQLGKEIFEENVLLDWEVDDFPCTPENKKLITEKHPQYIKDCIQKADDNKNFKERTLEDQVGK